VLRIEYGQSYEEPTERGVAEELDQGVGEEMRDFGIAGIGCEQGTGEANPAGGPEKADGQFDERIADTDAGAAGAAAATQQDPA
jgi:hypothetical protein